MAGCWKVQRVPSSVFLCPGCTTQKNLENIQQRKSRNVGPPESQTSTLSGTLLTLPELPLGYNYIHIKMYGFSAITSKIITESGDSFGLKSTTDYTQESVVQSYFYLLCIMWVLKSPFISPSVPNPRQGAGRTTSVCGHYLQHFYVHQRGSSRAWWDFFESCRLRHQLGGEDLGSSSRFMYLHISWVLFGMTQSFLFLQNQVISRVEKEENSCRCTRDGFLCAWEKWEVHGTEDVPRILAPLWH